MKRLLLYFLRGLLLTIPTVVTAWLFFEIFTRIDGWLRIVAPDFTPFTWPGVGFLITVVAVTLIGFMGSNLITRGLVAAFESLIEKLPLVRLVYNAMKDLIGAFVGEKKRFDKPVIVAMSADGAVRALGFITQESLDALKDLESVVVYLPFSYSIAGWTCVVKRDRVQRLDTSSSDFMAFVVSGGVTDFPPAR
jgi:uncharacterized membrane protein